MIVECQYLLSLSRMVTEAMDVLVSMARSVGVSSTENVSSPSRIGSSTTEMFAHWGMSDMLGWKVSLRPATGLRKSSGAVRD